MIRVQHVELESYLFYSRDIVVRGLYLFFDSLYLLFYPGSSDGENLCVYGVPVTGQSLSPFDMNLPKLRMHRLITSAFKHV